MKQLHTQRRLFHGVLVAGLALLLAGAMFQPAAASSVTWLTVRLGTHRFGHLSKADAIVAKAGPKDVGFWTPENGEGPGIGPWSFDVARDGSMWLMDEFNDRLLVWSRGRPKRPARIIPLPFPAPVDFALGRRGMVYVFSQPPGDRGYLYALTAAGKVRWKARTIVELFNSQLRMAPDGSLYYYTYGEQGWVPVVTSTGRPVPLAEQRRRASPYQPLSGGLRLLTADVSRHEKDFTVIDQAGKVARAWRVTSKTTLWPGPATAALVGRDLVVAVDVTRQTKTEFLWEHLILRLGSAGGTRARLTLDPHVISGVDPPITELRVGPDGQLYQLRLSLKTGASIARYSLDAPEIAPPKPTPASASAVPPSPAPTRAEPSVIQPSVTQAPVTYRTMAAPKDLAPSTRPATAWIIPGLVALAASTLVGLSLWLRSRRRRSIDRPS